MMSGCPPPALHYTQWLSVNAGWFSVWELGALCHVTGEDGSWEWQHLLGYTVVCAGGIRFNHSQACFTPIIASESTWLTSPEKKNPRILIKT